MGSGENMLKAQTNILDTSHDDPWSQQINNLPLKSYKLAN